MHNYGEYVPRMTLPGRSLYDRGGWCAGGVCLAVIREASEAAHCIQQHHDNAMLFGPRRWPSRNLLRRFSMQLVKIAGHRKGVWFHFFFLCCHNTCPAIYFHNASVISSDAGPQQCRLSHVNTSSCAKSGMLQERAGRAHTEVIEHLQVQHLFWQRLTTPLKKNDKDYSQKVSGLGLKCYPAQPSRRAWSVSLFPLMEKVKPWENVSVAAVYPSHITCHTQRTTHNVPPLPNMAVNLGPAVKPRRLTYLATALGLDSLLVTDNFLLCKIFCDWVTDVDFVCWCSYGMYLYGSCN